MNKTILGFLAFISPAVFCVAEQNAPDLSALSAAMGALAKNSPQQPAVDFRKLKAWLPAELGGMKRTSASGEKTGMGGINVSVANADYSKGDDISATLTVTDLGGMGPMGVMAQAGMLASDIDRESDDGYERSFVLKGNKGLESYQTKDKSGEIKLFVGGRYMVEIDAANLPAASLRKIAEELDLAALAAIKGEE